MIPMYPYLQNAVSGYNQLFETVPKSYQHYRSWLQQQGIVLPIMMDDDIRSAKIEFTDPKLETMFVLRWS